MTALQDGNVSKENTVFPKTTITKYFNRKMDAVSYASKVLLKVAPVEISQLTIVMKPDGSEDSFVSTVTIDFWDGLDSTTKKKFNDFFNI